MKTEYRVYYDGVYTVTQVTVQDDGGSSEFFAASFGTFEEALKYIDDTSDYSNSANHTFSYYGVRII
jgi:hypothetical protein